MSRPKKVGRGRPFRAEFDGHCAHCLLPYKRGSSVCIKWPDKLLVHAQCEPHIDAMLETGKADVVMP